MCLIAFAWQAHPRYPLIVAANRDEFLARPTASAAWWADRPVLAGRDLSGGGTWMGVTPDGRFAALTNHRDPADRRVDAPTRGVLVSDVLADPRGLEAALDDVAGRAGAYNGFNLLACAWRPDAPDGPLWIVESRGADVPTRVAPGVHALSNALLDTPWPKVRRASSVLDDIVARGLEDEALEAALFALLADRRIAPDAELPDTGLAPAWERALSAACIERPDYGTRTSTVAWFDRDGGVRFVERDVVAATPRPERRFAFALTAPG